MKYSYAIIQSIYGNLWVGKSKRKADEEHYFSTHQKAVDRAMLKFEDKHGLYDFDEDNCDDCELLEEYDAIQGTSEIEVITKGLEKFVI